MPEAIRQGRSVRGRAAGDQLLSELDSAGGELVAEQAHPMDAEEARKVHRQLLEWYYLERERQALNRVEMATDVDFYDNLQWAAEDAQEVKDRGQMPLVYNEVAPMVDWLLGTERRARVDWRVLPRTEDDVEAADTKTKVLKYVSDINRVPFARSAAFADAVKAGVGWLDDGVRDDPSQDILYSRSEDWRCVLWDSTARELDLSDARYLFRWRWVDLDVAIAMFPTREAALRRSAEDAPGWFANVGEDDEEWESSVGPIETEVHGRAYASGTGAALQARRPRVRLIEAQYRMPTRVRVVAAGAFKGAIVDPRDAVLMDGVRRGQVTQIVDRVMFRVHGAVMTEGAMLAMAPSIYRHNRFSLTPVWCYRRGRDRMPYGLIRRTRDIQQDLNKRASKAQFLINANQVIAEEGATEDWETLRDEASRPDGLIVHKTGKRVEFRRDTQQLQGQVEMMQLAASTIQRASGVNDDNLGRRTNASSGVAIEARQLQGAVQTTEPLDNLRFATQIQGEKQLSLAEQFYTEEKVIRLTGTKGALEWVRINVPELQADGSVRFLNDITASQADFMVSEQDYAGTMRQVMFESLNQMAQRLPPEVSLRILTIALEFSDLPNKDEIADAIRRITGERDPEKQMTPEEAAQAEEQMRQQLEAMEMQRAQAQAVLAEQQAKVRHVNAQAAKLEAEAAAAMDAGRGGMTPEVQQQIDQLRSQAAQELERMGEQLAKANAELANRTLQIKSDADAKVQVASIQAQAQERVALIQQASEAQIQPLVERIDALVQQVQEAGQAATEAQRRAEQAEKALQAKAQADEVEKAARLAEEKARGEAEKERKAQESKESKESKETAPAAPPAPPLTINVQVDATQSAGAKTITLSRDAGGALVGQVTPAEPAKKTTPAKKPAQIKKEGR